jgi:hypothetical protein
MNDELYQALQKIIDSLKDFCIPGSLYFLETKDIIDDCYRLQDKIKEDKK